MKVKLTALTVVGLFLLLLLKEKVNRTSVTADPYHSSFGKENTENKIDHQSKTGKRIVLKGESAEALLFKGTRQISSSEIDNIRKSVLEKKSFKLPVFTHSDVDADISLSFTYENGVVTASGNAVGLGEFSLAIEEGGLGISVEGHDGTYYEVLPSVEGGSLYDLKEYNYAELNRDYSCGYDNSGISKMSEFAMLDPEVDTDTGEEFWVDTQYDNSTTQFGKIMLAYSPDIIELAGNGRIWNIRMYMGVARLNQTLKNSGVNYAFYIGKLYKTKESWSKTVELVKAKYPEMTDTENPPQLLKAVSDGEDGILDDLKEMQIKTGCVILSYLKPGSGGIAGVYGSTNISRWSINQSIGFRHECGHNLGGAHKHGYWVPQLNAATLMGAANKPAGIEGTYRINYYSNINTQYKGYAVGSSEYDNVGQRFNLNKKVEISPESSFQLVPPLTPLFAGDKCETRWSSVNVKGKVKIDLLTRNKQFVGTIAESISNDGFYSWYIPENLINSKYRIRISSVEDPDVSSISQVFLVK